MDGPTTADPLAVLDGRLARSARTKAVVIDALLALYEAGDLTPTAQRVAAKAGVALRTVFGHFDDMESLYAEAGKREMAALGKVAKAVSARLPFDERVALFAANRATVLEWLLPVMRASSLREPTSPQLAKNRRVFVAAGDVETREVFTVELARLTAAEQTDIVHLVHVVAGGPAWTSLRIDRALPPAAAGRLLHASLVAVLGAQFRP